MNLKEKHDISRKLRILSHAKITNNISKTCRYFGISRETFYQWKQAYTLSGKNGLINNPRPENLKLRTNKLIEDYVIYLRTTYHFDPLKISRYLERFHDIKISRSCCYYILLRNSLNRLPANTRKRSIPQFKRYEMQVPGHHVQVDVKFLFFHDNEENGLSVFNIQQ